MLQIYFGDGKGKTTASIGLLTRASGTGLATAIIFFDKGGMEYGERAALKQLGIRVVATGLDRRNKKTGQFRFGVTTPDRHEARRGLLTAKKLITSGKYSIVVLDEVLNCIRLNMLPLKSVLTLLKKIGTTEVVLTGRGLPPEIAQIADLITEMREVKHYFTKGIPARKGIEY